MSYKILITGNLGFVGVETQKLLEKQGHQVIGYDLMNKFDIRDVGQLEEVINKTKPDRILHLAAIARFADADAHPKLAFQTNVIGTANVVAMALKYHIPLVFSSTGSAVMPLDGYPVPYNEEIPARGNSVYGCSKAVGEFYVKQCNPYIILRYAHLYGKEKRMHGLIGGFVDRIKRGLVPTLYGGKQSNDFTYIKDVARANVLALTAPWDKWNQTYNIGTGEELTAEKAGKIICEFTGWKGKIEKKVGRTVDPGRFVFDVSKAEKMLNFKAEYSFKKGLEDMFGPINPKHPHKGKVGYD